MNKKLIAAAVSATVMAPVVASAQDEGPSITVYARVNQAITVVDVDTPGSSSNVDVSNISSRFGLKGSADVGNGMTAHGRLEFSVGADREQPGVGDIRIGTVGLSGAFGSVTVGNQYSSYSTLVGTHFDPTYTLGYFIYSQVGAPYRASNTIKYANSFGPVSLGIDVRLNDNEEGKAVAEGTGGSVGANGNGFGISASFAASDNVIIAAGYDTEEATDAEVLAGIADQDLFGIAAQVSFGGFWGSLGWQQMDDGLTGAGTEREQVQIYLGTSFGEKTSAMIGYGQFEQSGTGIAANAPESNAVNVGIYHNLGGGMKLYYENLLFDADNDVGASSPGGSTFDNDVDAHYFGMRIDF
jgi:predicted porin